MIVSMVASHTKFVRGLEPFLLDEGVEIYEIFDASGMLGGEARFDKLTNTTAVQGYLAHKKAPPPRTLQ